MIKNAPCRLGMRHMLSGGLVLLVIGAAASPSGAGSSSEITWIPVPSIKVGPGKNMVKVRLPWDRFGTVRQSLFLVGWNVPSPTDLAATQPGPSVNKTLTLRIQSNGKVLPPWTLAKEPSAYLISLDTIAANPSSAKGELELEIDVTINGAKPGPPQINVTGCPDVALVSNSFDGTLVDFIKSIPGGPAREFFEGLALHVRGKLAEAGAQYGKVASAADEGIARAARRSLRLIQYLLRPPPAQGEFEAYRREALYLRQCGEFNLAFLKARYGGQPDAPSADNWHYESELAERLGWLPEYVAEGAEQAGQCNFKIVRDEFKGPVLWHVIVLILAEEDGVKLTKEQVDRIYHDWHMVEQIVFGASGGLLRFKTDFVYIADKTVQKYRSFPGGIVGPDDTLFPVRGSYDSVISVRPKGGSDTVGPDCGPNGAALTDLGPDRGWEVMLHEWNHQFDWAVQACEAGPGYPVTHDSDGCGIRPIPSMGFGHRSSMRYYVTPYMYRWTLIAAPEVPNSYMKFWKVEGPYEVSGGKQSSEGVPDKHVMDAFPPAGAASQPARTIDSKTDFVDLKAELGGMPKWGVARASCWVFSPQRYAPVPMWLGFNDGMAVWVNGRCIHRGRYYGTALWEDRNRTDMVMSHAILEAGWNKVDVVVESWPAPRDKGWGFSIRFCDWNNQALPGLAYRVTEPPAAERAPTWTPPQAGIYYDWFRAVTAYHELIPRLENSDLAKITGVTGLEVRGQILPSDPTRGYVSLGVPGAPASAHYRPLPEKWDKDSRDVTLNNVMDWSREDVAVFHYRKDGQDRALLIPRPEAIAAYLTLLKEAPGARAMADGFQPAQRVLGYVVLPPGSSERTLIVVDTFLGSPDTWPVDEEDLLTLPAPAAASAPGAASQPSSPAAQ